MPNPDDTHAPARSDDNPFGDDQGTRVGRPSTPDRDNVAPEGQKKGIDRDNSAPGTMSPGNNAALGIETVNDGGNPQRPGSEPLQDRTQEHEPHYGGKGGEPRPPA